MPLFFPFSCRCHGELVSAFLSFTPVQTPCSLQQAEDCPFADGLLRSSYIGYLLVRRAILKSSLLLYLSRSSEKLIRCNDLCKVRLVINDPFRNRMNDLPLIEMVFLHFKAGNLITARIYFHKKFSAGTSDSIKVNIE